MNTKPYILLGFCQKKYYLSVNKVEVWHQGISSLEIARFSCEGYSNCENMISLKAKAGISQDFKSSENSFITFITDSLER